MTDPLTIDIPSWQAALDEGSFEDATAALESVVACLERGQLRLEDALTLYELGVRLADRCEEDLANAELRVSQLAPVASVANRWDESREP